MTEDEMAGWHAVLQFLLGKDPSPPLFPAPQPRLVSAHTRTALHS